MPKVNIGLSRKVGKQNYGSLGASCHVEFELDGGYDNGSTERFQDAVRRAYAACRDAVETELAGHEQGTNPPPKNDHRSPTANRTADPRGVGARAKGATANQTRAIYAIANQNRISLADVLKKFNVTRPDQLCIGDASKVIDHLKSLSGTAVAG